MSVVTSSPRIPTPSSSAPAVDSFTRSHGSSHSLSSGSAHSGAKAASECQRFYHTLLTALATQGDGAIAKPAQPANGDLLSLWHEHVEGKSASSVQERLSAVVERIQPIVESISGAKMLPRDSQYSGCASCGDFYYDVSASTSGPSSAVSSGNVTASSTTACSTTDSPKVTVASSPRRSGRGAPGSVNASSPATPSTTSGQGSGTVHSESQVSIPSTQIKKILEFVLIFLELCDLSCTFDHRKLVWTCENIVDCKKSTWNMFLFVSTSATALATGGQPRLILKFHRLSGECSIFRSFVSHFVALLQSFQPQGISEIDPKSLQPLDNSVLPSQRHAITSVYLDTIHRNNSSFEALSMDNFRQSTDYLMESINKLDLLLLLPMIYIHLKTVMWNYNSFLSSSDSTYDGLCNTQRALTWSEYQTKTTICDFYDLLMELFVETSKVLLQRKGKLSYCDLNQLKLTASSATDALIGAAGSSSGFSSASSSMKKTRVSLSGLGSGLVGSDSAFGAGTGGYCDQMQFIRDGLQMPSGSAHDGLAASGVSASSLASAFASQSGLNSGSAKSKARDEVLGDYDYSALDFEANTAHHVSVASANRQKYRSLAVFASQPDLLHVSSLQSSNITGCTSLSSIHSSSTASFADVFENEHALFHPSAAAPVTSSFFSATTGTTTASGVSSSTQRSSLNPLQQLQHLQHQQLQDVGTASASATTSASDSLLVSHVIDLIGTYTTEDLHTLLMMILACFALTSEQCNNGSVDETLLYETICVRNTAFGYYVQKLNDVFSQYHQSRSNSPLLVHSQSLREQPNDQYCEKRDISRYLRHLLRNLPSSGAVVRDTSQH